MRIPPRPTTANFKRRRLVAIATAATASASPMTAAMAALRIGIAGARFHVGVDHVPDRFIPSWNALVDLVEIVAEFMVVFGMRFRVLDMVV